MFFFSNNNDLTGMRTTRRDNKKKKKRIGTEVHVVTNTLTVTRDTEQPKPCARLTYCFVPKLPT